VKSANVLSPSSSQKSRDYFLLFSSIVSELLVDGGLKLPKIAVRGALFDPRAAAWLVV